MGYIYKNLTTQQKKARIQTNIKWNKANPEKAHCYKLRTLYNITQAQKTQLLEAQGGRCAICGTPNPGHKNGWATDHNPNRQKGDPKYVRGILCHPCNQALGKFKDSIGIVKSALNYLVKHNV